MHFTNSRLSKVIKTNMAFGAHVHSALSHYPQQFAGLRSSLCLGCFLLGLLSMDCRVVAEVPPKPRMPRIGIAPSHITVSPNPLFADIAPWQTVARGIGFYKYYDVQVRNLAWASQIDVAAFVTFMKENKIGMGCEFGEFHLGTGPTIPDAAAAALNRLRLIYAAGGSVDSLHLDGPVRRMIKGCQDNPKALSLDEITARLVDFWQDIHAQYPTMRIGLISNFPNWDYTAELAGYNGHYTDQCGHTYAEVLDRIYGGLKAAGEKMAFLEIDCPFNYYIEKRTRAGDAPVDTPRMFREMQKWCRERGIDFHLVINAEPRGQGAKGFYDGTLEYVRRLHRDGITPDVFLIQSWYEEPEEHLPETEPYTFMYAARDALKTIQSLYGNPASAEKWRIY